jgi:hypothetical protein
MNDIDVHIKGVGSGHVRAGATVGEALERLATDAAGQALAAKVNGRAASSPPPRSSGPLGRAGLPNHVRPLLQRARADRLAHA